MCGLGMGDEGPVTVCVCVYYCSTYYNAVRVGVSRSASIVFNVLHYSSMSHCIGITQTGDSTDTETV
jgi:hypothetical protein